MGSKFSCHSNSLDTALKMNKVYVSRSAAEIEAFNLALITRNGCSKSLLFDCNAQNLWRKVHPLMRSPVQRTVRLPSAPNDALLAGISALNPLDHYIKEQLHVRYYLRYMDDFIMIHEDKAFLEACQEKIIAKLQDCRFEINPKKTRIFPIKEGIMFLGFQYRLTDTGKVLLFVNPKNVKAKRKNLRRLVAKSKKGLIPKASVDESYRAWKDHASKGNSYKLLRKMDEYYKSLWEEEHAEDIQETVPPGEGGGDQPAHDGAGGGEGTESGA